MKTTDQQNGVAGLFTDYQNYIIKSACKKANATIGDVQRLVLYGTYSIQDLKDGCLGEHMKGSETERDDVYHDFDTGKYYGRKYKVEYTEHGKDVQVEEEGEIAEYIYKYVLEEKKIHDKMKDHLDPNYIF